MPIKPRSRERNARRAAARQDLVLKRNPIRDERATGFGLYALVHADTGTPVHPVTSRLFCLSLQEVEALLDREGSGSVYRSREPLLAPSLPSKPQPSSTTSAPMSSISTARPSPEPPTSTTAKPAMRVPDTSAEWDRLLSLRRRAS